MGVQREAGHAGEILTSLGFSETKIDSQSIFASLPDRCTNILPASCAEVLLVLAQEYTAIWEIMGWTNKT